MSAPTIISASAGSGKTYALAEKFLDRIVKGIVKPQEVIATTFTIKAAHELKSRLRSRLIENGLMQAAQELDQALIGTVDAVCLQLIEANALTLGLSPKLTALEPAQQQTVIKEIVNDFIDDEFTELARRTGNDQVGFQDELKWINDLNDLMNLCRSNMIDHIKLPQMAQSSFESFWAHFPEPPEVKVDIIAQLTLLLNQFFETVSTENEPELWTDSAKTKYFGVIKIYDNIRSGRFTWPEIARLGGYKFAKYGGNVIIEAVKEVLLELHFDQQLRADQAQYTRKIFELAKKSISAYQDYKSDRGLLDFTDMEVHFHKALVESQPFMKALSEKFKLIMVDEFQDSSPLQVSIFQKLSGILDEAIWVGDPKQSIYAFRGADPNLFLSYVKHADLEKLETLPNSFRSRESLVNFSNALFTSAFEGHLSRDQVQLRFQPNGRSWLEKHTEGFEHGLQHWNFDSTNNYARYLQLASQIMREIDGKRLVFDKETQAYRPIQVNDIAVLCRTNSTIQGMSQALRSVGLTVITGGRGLKQTPEAVVILALLKWLIAPKDSLAIAELWLYTELNGDQDALLDLRKANLKNEEWGMEHPYLQVLAKEKASLSLLRPQKQIERLMMLLPLSQIMASWGDVESRLANVRQLITFADDYQQYAIASHQMISTGGYLSYVDRLAEDQVDFVGQRSGNALRVLTYHDSKGLEWPMVILWQLDFTLKTKLYGVRVESEKGFDVRKPLHKRKLAFYANPFNSENVAGFHSHLANAFQDAAEEAIKEEQRLMYVACTRARDYLILTGRSRKSSQENDLVALKRLTQEFSPSASIEQEDQRGIVYSGLKGPHSHEISGLYLDLPVSDLVPTPFLPPSLFFDAPKGIKPFPSKAALPSDQAPLLSISTGAIKFVHDPIEVKQLTEDVTEFGNSFHQIWCALFNWKDAQEKLEVIDHNLLIFNQQNNLDSGEILRSFDQFESYLLEQYQPLNIHRELPIYGEINEVEYQGFIDLVIEREKDLILIDYKSFALKNWHEGAYRKRALKYSGQLDVYKKLLEKSLRKPVSEVGIYFVVMGKIVLVDV